MEAGMAGLATINQSCALTMSSLEIAGLTGKAHKHVLVDVRKMLLALGRQPAEFSARYLDAKGEAACDAMLKHLLGD